MTSRAVLCGMTFNAFRAAFEYSIENINNVNTLLTHQQTFYWGDSPCILKRNADITMCVLTFTVFSIKVAHYIYL